jgi:hypothetical protein
MATTWKQDAEGFSERTGEREIAISSPSLRFSLTSLSLSLTFPTEREEYTVKLSLGLIN